MYDDPRGVGISCERGIAVIDPPLHASVLRAMWIITVKWPVGLSEVASSHCDPAVQEYLAHKKTPTTFLGPSQNPRHRPTAGS